MLSQLPSKLSLIDFDAELAQIRINQQHISGDASVETLRTVHDSHDFMRPSVTSEDQTELSATD